MCFKVVAGEIPIGKNGLLFLVDALIIPSSIQPIVKNICPIQSIVKVQGVCGDCTDKTTWCPKDSKPSENAKQQVILVKMLIQSLVPI